MDDNISKAMEYGGIFMVILTYHVVSTHHIGHVVFLSHGNVRRTFSK